MRKMQDFVLQGKDVYVGLEDSKRSWKICVRSGRMVVHEASMPAKYEVLASYLRKKFPECTITVMYEAGFSGFGLHDRLQADGWKCVVTPPHTVTEEKCLKQKNDRIDCRRLSKNLENGDYRQCHIPSQQRREDRQISRQYGQLHGDIVMVKNRIRRELEFHGLDHHFMPGRWVDRQYQEIAGRLIELKVSESLRFAFGILLKQLEQLRQLQRAVLKQLSTLAKSRPYCAAVKILKSVPGIGALTSIRLVLEWGDVSRFKRKEEFASFLGLTPGDYSTGDTDRKGHITKQGNRTVRKMLVESAWICIRKDPAMLDKFRRVVSHSGSSKKAIVAVARKLAIRLRALLITEKPYVLGVVE